LFFRDGENRILAGNLKDLKQPAESGEKISFPPATRLNPTFSFRI
jgi:hypothetical protein